MFSDMVEGSVCTKLQVCIVCSGGLVQINKPTDQVKIEKSSTGCSPHVDFDNFLGLHLRIHSKLVKP